MDLLMVLVDHTLSPRIEFFCVLPRVAIIYVKGERQDFLSFLETVFLSFDGEFHHSHPDSTISHTYTTLANIDGYPLAIGGEVGHPTPGTDEIGIDTNRTEIFDIQANMWIEVEEYPYHNT